MADVAARFGVGMAIDCCPPLLSSDRVTVSAVANASAMNRLRTPSAMSLATSLGSSSGRKRAGRSADIRVN